MNKVYIVTTGTYSDYGIYSVHTDEKTAKRVSNEMDGDVEEWGVDLVEPQLPPGHLYWWVSMRSDGDRAYADLESDGQDSLGTVNIGNGHINAVVSATSEKHAIKILNERRAQILSLPVQPVSGKYKWPSLLPELDVVSQPAEGVVSQG